MIENLNIKRGKVFTYYRKTWTFLKGYDILLLLFGGVETMPYAIDLFCGAGGMSEGLIQAGFHIIFSSDINSDVEKTYKNRHQQLGLIQGVNTYFHRADIRELTGHFILNCINNLRMFDNENQIEDIDAIFGGPPCQGFSRAGRRMKDDPRNLLFREYIRVVNEIHPKYVVMENVEGFLDTRLDEFEGVLGNKYPKNVLVTDLLISEFQQIGYNVILPFKILDASNFGVPQRRKRVIFIAYREGEVPPTYPEPINGNNVTLLEAIGDLIRDNDTREILNPMLTEYQLQSIHGRTPNLMGETIPINGESLNNEISKHLPIIVERFRLYREGEDTVALRKRILSEGIDLTNKPQLINHIRNIVFNNEITNNEIVELFMNGNINEDLINALLTKKNARTKLNSNNSSLTIVTLPDDYISPFEDRIFSVRELARLQSFDDSFEFLGKRTTGGKRRKLEVPQYSQVGNAVPPLLAKAVASKIMEAIEAE